MLSSVYKSDSGNLLNIIIVLLFGVLVLFLLALLNLYLIKIYGIDINNYSDRNIKIKRVQDHINYMNDSRGNDETFANARNSKLSKSNKYFFRTDIDSFGMGGGASVSEDWLYKNPEGLGDIKDKKSQEIFARAIAYRNDGEMGDAIKFFNKLDKTYPSHPRILYETSVVYEEIKNIDKAQSIWEKIYDMGDRAGSLYTIVAKKLNKNQGNNIFELKNKEKILSFTNIDYKVINRDFNQETVIISFHLRAEPGVIIDTSKVTPMLIVVDEIEGGVLQLSNMSSREEFLSPPLDWSDSPEEIFKFTFTRPELNNEDKLNLGKRKYYGFKAVVLYNNQTQDIIAIPKELKNMNFESFEMPQQSINKSKSENTLFYNDR